MLAVAATFNPMVLAGCIPRNMLRKNLSLRKLVKLQNQSKDG